MRKTIAIIAITLIAILLLSGCTGLRKSKEPSRSTIDFRVGSKGLEMKALPGTPPPKLYEGDALNLVVEYTNKGAYDISNGKMYVSGYDTKYIQFFPDQLSSFNAEGKSEFNPEGEFSQIVTFTDTSVSLPPNTERFPQTFKITACYMYKTFANALVCIDPDPFSIQAEDKVCVVRDISLGTQGAPIAVTKIEEEVSKRRVQFKVHVSNVGGETVISPENPGALVRCHAELDRDEIDKVRIKAEFSGKQLNCKPDIIRLVNGQGVSFCVYDGDLGRDAFQTVLNVELDYGYRNSVAAKVDILRLPGSSYGKGRSFP